MIEIKFDSLASTDLSTFAFATSSDYPNGRYSATITKVEPQTSDKSGKFCLRFRLSLAIDQADGKPRLSVTDLISFTNGNAYSAIGSNVFCDLAECVGLPREVSRSACDRLRDALAAGDKPAVASTFRELAEIASAFAGSRVAPNIEWTQLDDSDRQFANVRGSRTTPSYASARNEIDPGSSFTGDDCDMERQPKPRRNLKAVRR